MNDELMIKKLKEGGIVSIRDYLLELQTKGENISRTESGDPSFDIPNNVKESIEKSMNQNKTHYTAGAGINELRQEIFNKLTTENNISLNSYKDIIVTNGAMNALFNTFHSIVNRESNSCIYVPNPTWTETRDNVIEVGGHVIDFNFDSFNENEPIDIISLEQNIKDCIEKEINIKAVVINSPHNPTGTILNKEILIKLIEVCKKYNLYLVSDEAYEHVVYEKEHISPASLSDYEKIVSIFSMSKSYAMSGLRIGYVSCKDTRLMKKISKITRCTINGVNSITQWGAVSALRDTPKEYIENNKKEYLKRRDMLYDSLCKCSFLKPVKPQGAFYIWCKIEDFWKPEIKFERGWHCTLELLKHGIGSAPGDVFGIKGTNHIRFAFSCDTSHIDIASKKLEVL